MKKTYMTPVTEMMTTEEVRLLSASGESSDSTKPLNLNNEESEGIDSDADLL